MKTRGKVETLEGRIITVIWEGKDEENKDRVIAVLDNDTVVIGDLPGARAGIPRNQHYRLTGEWVDSPRHGLQFHFEGYLRELPRNPTAVEKYLAENCPEVGPERSKLMTGLYGEQTLQTLKDDPVRVSVEVRGMTEERAREISRKLLELEGDEAVTIRLLDLFKDLPIPKRTVQRCKQRWGTSSAEVLEDNPYELTTLRGVGFKRADMVARRLKHDLESPFRLRSGISHVVGTDLPNDGDVCRTRDRVEKDAVKLLAVDRTHVKLILDAMLDDGDLILERPQSGAELIYDPRALESEKYVAWKLQTLMREPAFVSLGDVDLGHLRGDQVEAFEKARHAPVFVLTGAPGTGKTFLLKTIIGAVPEGTTVALCAPTGKAAKRMTELTGREAFTVHRLLESTPSPQTEEDDELFFAFGRNEENPLDAGVLIMDEWSMCDNQLAADLLRAVVPETKIIFVGDHHQLPSVGPGNVLRDMIGSGAVPSAELTEIKRQDAGHIVRGCHRIKDGRLPDFGDPAAGDDLIFVPRSSPEEVARAVVALASERIPNRFKLDPLTEVQVLTARRTPARGIDAPSLNATLQEKFFPDRAVEGFRFRVGDKVVFLRNRFLPALTGTDPEVLVVNGDLGFVSELNPAGRTKKKHLVVDFVNPDRKVEVGPANVVHLDLAYALTVHKFQGSEVSVVVAPVHPCAGALVQQRNWLYTLISRATDLCVLVGSQKEVRALLRRTNQLRRVTLLEERLKGSI